MEYTFQEFSDHMAAMDQVANYKHVTTPGAGSIELSDEPSFGGMALRVSEYMRDLYGESPESLRKATCFMSIMNFAAHHQRTLELRGLAYSEDGGFMLKDEAWRAIHHLHAKQFFTDWGKKTKNPTLEEAIALVDETN